MCKEENKKSKCRTSSRRSFVGMLSMKQIERKKQIFKKLNPARTRKSCKALSTHEIFGVFFSEKSSESLDFPVHVETFQKINLKNFSLFIDSREQWKSRIYYCGKNFHILSN